MPVPCCAGAVLQIFEPVSKQNETRIKVLQRHLTETADWAVSSTILKIPEKIQEPQEMVLISTILEHPVGGTSLSWVSLESPGVPSKTRPLSRTNPASVHAQGQGLQCPHPQHLSQEGWSLSLKYDERLFWEDLCCNHSCKFSFSAAPGTPGLSLQKVPACPCTCNSSWQSVSHPHDTNSGTEWRENHPARHWWIICHPTLKLPAQRS